MRSAVEGSFKAPHIPLRDGRKARFLWEVLTDKAVGVFVRAALP